MPALHELGILPPRLPGEPRYQDRTTIPHEEFCIQAGSFLLELIETVKNDTIPSLENYPAKWQPMGFQIYDLGIYPELGFLRLHAWPAILRRASEKTDIIHSHPRHIASTVLSGTYRDFIFDVKQADEHKYSQRTDRYKLYGKSIKSDGSEVLVNEDSLVEAVVKEDRKIATGGQHFIPPDIFHQTQVPLSESCITLVFNSFRTSAEGPYVLLDEPPSPVAKPREPITAEEIDGVKELFS